MLLRNYFFFKLFLLPAILYAQETTIHGFAHTEVTVSKEDFSFRLGEQDLFISSELNDNLSFLGEIVLKYSNQSSTAFNVSIERMVLKYNYVGNHNVLIGKRHTPIDYWNDSYHHGRIFFPTIDRPKLFSYVPIHTIGISFRGHNLGDHNFGYDLMLGNGMSSSDVKDYDKSKSLTLSVHYKPKAGTKLSISYYKDKLLNNSSGVHTGHSKHGNVLNGYDGDINYQLYTFSVACFNPKFELLNEFILNKNSTDSLGDSHNMGLFLYAGYRIDKVVPYLAFDVNKIDPNDLHFPKYNLVGVHFGSRYEFNYLAIIKMEYRRNYYRNSLNEGLLVEKSVYNEFKIQIALGF